jgi:hypothetical protein
VATTVTAASATATTAHACKLRAKLMPTTNLRVIAVIESDELTGVFIQTTFRRLPTEPMQNAKKSQCYREPNKKAPTIARKGLIH